MKLEDDCTDRSWFVTGRWQQYEGEGRANELRILAIGTFYLIHLWHYFSSQGILPAWGVLQLAETGQLDRRFHMMITLLVLAWIMLAAVVHFALAARCFPGWLPTVTTLSDVLFLTSILMVSSGPQSPLIVGYFLVIALAALRFDLRLVQVTTLATVFGYVSVLGFVKWPHAFGHDTDVDYRVPRYEQLIVLAGLILTGVIVGQLLRRVRRVAVDYAARSSLEGGSAK